MLRQPAVAGQFYSSDPHSLRSELNAMIAEENGKETALGIIAPHAGYIYSGAVAGAVYGVVDVPDTVIILGPNHHGFGPPAALYPSGEWLTPLGRTSINRPLSDLIVKHSSQVEEDSTAHRFEHSLEVQLPFLQYIRPDVSIVPLCLGFGDYASCEELGKSLAGAIREFGRNVLIVASSDMSHYESVDAARKKDNLALNEVLALNPAGLYSVVRGKGITMCGVIPAAVMLVAALELGATKSRLVRYATSGEVSGDYGQVVGYASVIVS